VFRVQRAQDICLAIERCVKHRIVIGVGQNDWGRDGRFYKMRYVTERPGKACGFGGGDAVPKPQARVHQYPFHFVENESRQHEGVRAENYIKQTQCGTLWAGRSANQNV